MEIQVKITFKEDISDVGKQSIFLVLRHKYTKHHNVCSKGNPQEASVY